jgi:hypothetical protein
MTLINIPFLGLLYAIVLSTPVAIPYPLYDTGAEWGCHDGFLPPSRQVLAHSYATHFRDRQDKEQQEASLTCKYAMQYNDYAHVEHGCNHEESAHSASNRLYLMVYLRSTPLARSINRLCIHLSGIREEETRSASSFLSLASRQQAYPGTDSTDALLPATCIIVGITVCALVRRAVFSHLSFRVFVDPVPFYATQ